MAFSKGDEVLIRSNGDRGVVVDDRTDEDGNCIRKNAVAVQVENGQGVWGFYPGELQPVLRYNGVLPTGPDEQDNTAWDREETEPCERGTVGCSVQHKGDTDCATW